MMASFFSPIVSLVVLASLSALVFSSCFEPSEPLPAPLLNPGSSDLLALFSGLDSVIAKAVTQTTASWNTTITSHAIDVTSANETLWQSFHTAPLLGQYDDEGPTNVTGNTAFRIASISKVFTVLAILLQQQAGNLNLKDPVTKYLPDLRENDISGGVQWEQISLESLASQLSGVPRECPYFEIASLLYTNQNSRWPRRFCRRNSCKDSWDSQSARGRPPPGSC